MRNSAPLRLYWDICTYCRPFDDQDTIRVRLETDAYFLILSGIQRGAYTTVISPVHLEEAAAIADTWERIELLALFKVLKTNISHCSDKLRKRAEYLCSLNFGVADAAHVAFAEATADIFITCDDKLS
jgi:hypothetical protein